MGLSKDDIPSTCVQLWFRRGQKDLRHAVWCESLDQRIFFIFFCLLPCLALPEGRLDFCLSHVCKSLKHSGKRSKETASE